MAVVTINAQAGSGAPELGTRVAHLLGADYIDRLIWAEAAKRLGATVQALSQMEQRGLSLGDRLARLLQNFLERSAMAGTGGDPYFGPGMEALLAQPYEEIPPTPLTRAQELDEKRFIEVTTEVIQDLAKTENVVIIGRGSCMILKETPNSLHVGMVADMETRIKTIMNRLNVDWGEAEKYVIEVEKARQNFFRKFFKVTANDPTLYDMTLNASRISLNHAAAIVVEAITTLEQHRL